MTVNDQDPMRKITAITTGSSAGKFTTADGYLHDSVEDAEDWNTRRFEFYAAVKRWGNQLPDTLTAEEYSALCAEANVPCYRDDELDRMSYGITYGEFYPKPVTRWQGKESRGYPVSKYIEMALAAKRLRAIEEARKAARAATPARPVEMVHCDCGHSIARNLVMSASLGTSCPDCYDRMSD